MIQSTILDLDHRKHSSRGILEPKIPGGTQGSQQPPISLQQQFCSTRICGFVHIMALHIQEPHKEGKGVGVISPYLYISLRAALFGKKHHN